MVLETVKWYEPIGLDAIEVVERDWKPTEITSNWTSHREESSLEDLRVLSIAEASYDNTGINRTPDCPILAEDSSVPDHSVRFPYMHEEHEFVVNADAGMKNGVEKNPFALLAKTVRRADRHSSSDDEDDGSSNANEGIKAVVFAARKWKKVDHNVVVKKQKLEERLHALLVLMRDIDHRTIRYKELQKEHSELSIKLAHLHMHNSDEVVADATDEEIQEWIAARKTKMNVSMACDPSSPFGQKLSSDIRELDRRIAASRRLGRIQKVELRQVDIEEIPEVMMEPPETLLMAITSEPQLTSAHFIPEADSKIKSLMELQDMLAKIIAARNNLEEEVIVSKDKETKTFQRLQSKFEEIRSQLDEARSCQ